MPMAARRGRPRKSRPVSLGGDHGTGTALAIAGTRVEKLDGPNQMGRRVRINQIRSLEKRKVLTMRQIQAADAIQQAYCRVEMNSSGGALKEQVDSSPRPDAIIASQVDAQSRLECVMRPVLRSERAIVETVCWHNRRLALAPGPRQLARFRDALDRVADHLRY